MLIFVVASPGPIAELKIAAAFPQNSLVFLRADLESSFVGQDELVDARNKGAKVFFYTSESGCSLRAFAVDFLMEKVEEIWGYLEAERDAAENLVKLGVRKRRRGRHGKA